MPTAHPNPIKRRTGVKPSHIPLSAARGRLTPGWNCSKRASLERRAYPLISNSSTPIQAAHVSAQIAHPTTQLYPISLLSGDGVTVAVDTARYGGGPEQLSANFPRFRRWPGRARARCQRRLPGRDAGLTFPLRTPALTRSVSPAWRRRAARSDLNLPQDDEYRRPLAARPGRFVVQRLRQHRGCGRPGEHHVATVENLWWRPAWTPGTVFNVDFYLSTDSTITADDTYLTTWSVGPLDAGASFTQTFSITQPDAAPGQI